MLHLLLVAHLHAQQPAAPAPAATPVPTETAPAAAPAPAPAPAATAAPTPAASAKPKEEAKPKAEISMSAWLKELVHLAGTGDYSGILVVGTMFGMLLWSMYVGFERLMLFRRARNQSRDLAGALGKALTAGDFAGALKAAKTETYKDSYLGKVVEAALTEYEEGHDAPALEAARREIERATAMEQGRLREGLGVLATTGSTTPFVGLVGTVLGIIRCFGAMNSEGGADLASLSGGIAEALYSTALGIVVAIVGIWIYNYFNSVLEDITKDLTTATQQLVNVLEKDVRRRGDAAASK
jgi:biopolymer transport protein ExbB/TolQ